METGSENSAGRLLSLNTGLPVDVAWRGETVHTAIWKRPVPDRRMVRRMNVDGDGQGDLAGHGGEHRAVLVYRIESYSYWETRLNRRPVGYEPEPLEPPAEASVLICCARPIGDLDIDL